MFNMKICRQKIWFLALWLLHCGVQFSHGEPIDGRTMAATPLWNAAKQNDLAGIKKAIANGADVNAPDESGATALIWACVNIRERRHS